MIISLLAVLANMLIIIALPLGKLVGLLSMSWTAALLPFIITLIIYIVGGIMYVISVSRGV